MGKISLIKKELKKDWYIQGFNGYPIFLNSAAHSGLLMKDELGFGYQEFVFDYQNGHGGMWYLESDFDRIWKKIKTKLSKDPKYLQKVKKRYEDIFRRNEKTFSMMRGSMPGNFDDDELLSLLKNCSRSATDGVGIAHVLDPIGPKIEGEFKKELEKFINEKNELNQAYEILTTPEDLSFIAREEEELRIISKLPEKHRLKKMKEHAEKYHWIQNSFAGSRMLYPSYFQNRMKELAKKKPFINDVRKRKKKLLKKYKFSQKVLDMAELINFSAIWQDERKANVLKSIGYFSQVIDEVSKRLKIEKDTLYYLGFSDVLSAKYLDDIKNIKKDLIERKKGLYVLMKYKKEINFSGKYYLKLKKYREQKQIHNNAKIKELHGSIACRGTASGRAVVCLGVSSIKKVKKGDILVASMTRPEYMPALKKAVAIITDEGGITSHAAIIARELGIPAVIGTKVATKVLKDGDLVEVRANHGLVKILKRRKYE